MTFKINSIPPKRLAATITAAATTFQLTDILGFDGVALTSAIIGDTVYGSFQNPSGTIVELFKIDPTTIGNSSITMSKRGLQFNEDGTETEVAGNKLIWVKGSTIVNLGTDAPALFNKYIDNANNQNVAGIKTFSSSPIVPTPTTDYQASTKKYVDDTDAATDAVIAALDAATVKTTGNQSVAGIKAFSSSPTVPTGGTGTQAANATDIANAITGASGTATNSTNGTLKLSVAAASVPDPIAVGDNDPRVPTQDENNALAGTGTPSSSNKYVTEDTYNATFKYGGGADGAIDLDGTNTYSFLSKSGSVYTMTRNIYCTDITIRTGATLKTDGFIYFFTGTLTGAGTAKITWGTANAGSNASGNTAGAGGAATSVSGPIKNVAGGNGGQGGYPGVTGQGQGGTAGASQTSSPGASGRTGGNGDGGTPGSGGGGGTATTRFPAAIIAFLTMVGCDITSTGALISYIGSAGSGGGGGGGRVDGGSSFGGGGGAGASGGGCIGFGNAITGVLNIENLGAAGGNGATLNGQTGGGGAGGAGGWSILIYKTKTATVTYTQTGGAGGTGANTPATAPTGVSYEVNIADLTR